MVKILGFLDLFAAVILLSVVSLAKVPILVLIIVPILLFLKSLFSVFDIGSLIDDFIAILIILSIFIHLPLWLLFAGAVLIGFKGFLSFLAP